MEPEGYSYSRPWWGAAGDLAGAASGWERSGCCCEGQHLSPSYLQDGTLLALLAAGALAFYVLYSTITMGAGAGAEQPAGFFRVKRNSASTFPTGELTSESSLADWILRGNGPCLTHRNLDNI